MTTDIAIDKETQTEDFILERIEDAYAPVILGLKSVIRKLASAENTNFRSIAGQPLEIRSFRGVAVEMFDTTEDMDKRRIQYQKHGGQPILVE